MSDPNIRFIVFALFSTALLFLGWMSRSRGWVPEHAARRIHMNTVIFVWSWIVLFSFWRIDINYQLLVFILIQPVMMLASWLVVRMLCRILKFNREWTGILIIAAMNANQGFTLGAYLIFVLFDNGLEAMSYAIAYASTLQFFVPFLIYPIARHYGPEDTGSIWKLIFFSIFDIRAAQTYAAIAGTILSVTGVAFPTWIDAGWLTALIFLGSAGAYFGIGLRLRVDDIVSEFRQIAALSLTKFMILPVIAMAVVTAISVAGEMLDVKLLTSQMHWIVVFLTPMPAGITSVMIANMFHLDARKASSIWLWNTVAFLVVVLPVLAWLDWSV